MLPSSTKSAHCTDEVSEDMRHTISPFCHIDVSSSKKAMYLQEAECLATMTKPDFGFGQQSSERGTRAGIRSSKSLETEFII